MKHGKLNIRILCFVLLLALLPGARAFVLMGPLSGQEGTDQDLFNLHDQIGTPKEIDRGVRRFWRWNQPNFTYSFDQSFIGFFGPEGMDAVTEAVNVINDFFDNEDYSGMSQLDLAKHGFAGNYNTTWLNTTAANAQMIDIKSLTLGMLVNHLGIGNSQRHMFTGVAADLNTTVNFQVALRNYDPTSLLPTDVVNGVQYSYRLVHDTATVGIPAGGLVLPTFADFEEFTTDTTGNAYSSVASIVDAFYGNTALYWTDTPSLFNFGIYYDGMNAMGGQFQPRHALTYDDAGGLKYLYSPNNYVFEAIDANVMSVETANYDPPLLAIHKQNPFNRQFPFGFPRGPGAAGGGAGSMPATRQITSPISWAAAVTPPAFDSVQMRGGIDKIKFHFLPFDSLLDVTYVSTNFIWTDNFLYKEPRSSVGIADANGRVVGSLSTQQPGIQWSAMNPGSGLTFYEQPGTSYVPKSQKLGRSVTQPDLLFAASTALGNSGGVPVGWSRDVPIETTYGLAALSTAGNYTHAGNSTVDGPGIFSLNGVADGSDGGVPAVTGLNAASFAFVFNRNLHENFEVIWSGEASLVGNMDGQGKLWAHITGPGPDDMVIFPKDNLQWVMENSILPDTAPPTITMISDNGGASAIEENSLTRTEEVLTIIGSEMASVTAIEIMNGDLVMQTIMPVGQYIVSNTRIDIPAGILSEAGEGLNRQVRVWNSVGASEKGVHKFKIETGRPVITSTSSDNLVFDRAQMLTVNGFGFKSKNLNSEGAEVALIRVDDSTGAAVYDNATGASPISASDGVPIAVSNITVLSDNQVLLPMNAIGNNMADGSDRRLRVARKTETAPNVDNVLSPGTNAMFTAITTKPVVTTLAQYTETATWERIEIGDWSGDGFGLGTGYFKRDRIMEINGTGLNTATTIEITQQDGSSFPNPVFISLPNAGVAVEDNGTRIQVASDSIPWSDADTNSSTEKRAFKIYNAVGNTDLNASQTFAVNKQPVVDGIGGFAVAGYMNRDKAVGDDIAVYGSGFLAASQVFIADDNDASQARVTITLPAPGVTVTDTSIILDTQTYQIGSGADTLLDGVQRIITVSSGRDNATSPVAQRFRVGAPPTLATLTGLSSDDGLNYRRDTDTMAFTGTGFGHMTQVEIVDANGNPIVGAPGLVSGADGTGGTGLTISTATAAQIEVSATGWSTMAYLLDSGGNNTRRLKITTPFGSITSNATAGQGTFRMGAAPTVGATVVATYAGGGFDGSTTTYDQSEGDLIINGTNFRSLTSITYSAGGTVNVDVDNPPAGITVSADGKKITIASANVPAAYIAAAAPTITLTTLPGLTIATQAISTQE